MPSPSTTMAVVGPPPAAVTPVFMVPASMPMLVPTVVPAAPLPAPAPVPVPEPVPVPAPYDAFPLPVVQLEASSGLQLVSVVPLSVLPQSPLRDFYKFY